LCRFFIRLFPCGRTGKKPDDSCKKQGLHIRAWDNKNSVGLGLGCIFWQKRQLDTHGSG
jgi:hypothetical protein